MKVYISDVGKSVMVGDDDTALNTVITAYMSDNNIAGTVAEWRLANYRQLRRWAYPDKGDFLDAMIKREAGELAAEAGLTDPKYLVWETQGKQEFKQLAKQQLGVKDRFPSE